MASPKVGLSLHIQNISKKFAADNLFEGLSLKMTDKSRIGLIGRNGCGKSTLLKIIMGTMAINEGSIYRAPGLSVNYLTQEPQITPGLTLEEEMRTAFLALNELTEKEAELIEKLNDPTLSVDDQMKFVGELGHVQQEVERLDGYNVDARIGRILKGLGFSLDDYQRKTEEFSGGWQMRINLAKILLERAHILLLDEPTNHLDMASCEWLESFLKDYPGGIVLVSHDRHFLDEITTEIAELEKGKMKVWKGNYTQHLEQKAIEMDQMVSAFNRQEKEIGKQQAFVDRFRASARRSTQAKSREKAIAKIDRVEVVEEDKRQMTIRFPAPQPSGRQVLTLRKVTKAFEDKEIFKGFDADFERDQRIFLLGANGTGKTTLLRLILGLEPLDAGEIKPGHQVNIGYFSQNQLETLNPELTVFDTLKETCPKLTNTELRSLLGRFLFSGDQVFKKVSVLSGGEKSKLALANLMMSGPNTLLLDEPTNHMDISAKEVMTKALRDYEGSMLCISHDRYFIQELATNIWEIYEGHLINYGGDYDYYLRKRDEMQANIIEKNAKPSKNNKKLESSPKKSNLNQVFTPERKEQEKELKRTEKKVIQAEKELAILEKQLSEPELQKDYEKLQEVGAQLKEKQKIVSGLNQKWETLADALK